MPRPASAQPHNGNRRLWNNASLAVIIAIRQSADLLICFIFLLNRFFFLFFFVCVCVSFFFRLLICLVLSVFVCSCFCRCCVSL